MRCRPAIVLSLALLNLSAILANSENVVFASRRAGWIEVFDANSLNPITRLKVGHNADTINASPDGQIIYLSQGLRDDPEHGCCSLYAVNLQDRNMKFLLDPATGQRSSNRNKLFTQRGNGGIETFDSKTLKRLPTIKAYASYELYPSPDDHWIFGITSSGEQSSNNFMSGPSVDIFDLGTNLRIRQLPVPHKQPVGAWVDKAFYVVAVEGRTGHLWRVDAETTTLGTGKEFELQGLEPNPRFQFLSMVAANGHLFLYEEFGLKLDPRDGGKQVTGGIFEIDPVKALVVRHLAPALHFFQLVPSPGGKTLYGMDVPSWSSPRLVRIDIARTEALLTHDLPSDIWHIDVANVPRELLDEEEIEITVK